MKQDAREVTTTVSDFDNIVFNAVVRSLKIDVESSDRETLKQAMRITDAVMEVIVDIAVKQAKSAAGRKAAQARYNGPDPATVATAQAQTEVFATPKKNKGGRPRKNPQQATIDTLRTGVVQTAAQQKAEVAATQAQDLFAPPPAPAGHIPTFVPPTFAPPPAQPAPTPGVIVPPFGS